MATLEIAYNIILPIFIVVGLAAWIDHKHAIDPHAMSRLLIYFFSPALVFRSLAFMEIPAGEAGLLIGNTLIVSITVGIFGYLLARNLRFDRHLESAFVLSMVLLNAGNLGISLNRLAFGQAGEERAVLCYIGSSILGNTIGVFLASRGSMSTRAALLNILKTPIPYTMAAGILVNTSNAQLPDPIVEAVDIIADAAIPGMIAVLGIQLSRTLRASRQQKSGSPSKLKTAMVAAGMRLLVAPLIAFPLTAFLGMSGLTRDVAIVQASMPTAVLAGVLATEFGADAEHVTTTILIGTIASIATLSIILSIVM
ncbi:MAG: AEC family transporter [Anaerolineae bacterium]|nr:AEC family transporter [Anaerolineae bacterium]